MIQLKVLVQLANNSKLTSEQIWSILDSAFRPNEKTEFGHHGQRELISQHTFHLMTQLRRSGEDVMAGKMLRYCSSLIGFPWFFGSPKLQWRVFRNEKQGRLLRDWLKEQGKVENLSIVGPGLTDEDAICLRSNTSIKSLMLRPSTSTAQHLSISKNGFAQIATIPNLKYLSIERGKIEGLSLERSFPSLQVLSLMFCEMPEATLVKLARISNLEKVRLTGTKESSTLAINCFAQNHNLEELFVDYTTFGDPEIACFATNRTLKFITVRGSRTTVQGLAELSKLLPACQIDPAPDQVTSVWNSYSRN